jgi:hypothetical protein
MPAKRKGGFRCDGCRHLLGTTTAWSMLSGTKIRTQMLCAECTEDVLAVVRTLQREHAKRPRRVDPGSNGTYSLAVST